VLDFSNEDSEVSLYDAKVLVIDDKPNYLSLLTRILSERYEVTTAKDGQEGLALLRSRSFDIVVSDIKMPNMDGLTLLSEAKLLDSNLEVILMTAFGSVDKAVEAMKAGAYHYLTKPFEPDELSLLVSRALERRRLRAKAHALDILQEGAAAFGDLIGDSAPMRAMLSLLRKVAPMNLTVLIEGESGTGKELIARAIHQQSPRKDAPFIAINCGALPESILESELFGHKKGAFTGALEDRIGLFEAAHEGSIFLDEIGELPISLQSKLNRVLQEGEIRRLGETRSRKIDVRVIAATLRDLKSMSESNQFREDLYYRLNVFRVKVPPLRERRDDILRLAEFLLKKHAKTLKMEVPTITPAVSRMLIDYSWPGNVRELEHAMERALVVAERGEITPEALPQEINGLQWSSEAPINLSSMSYKQALEIARDQMSAEYLRQLFAKHQGNVTSAALAAGIERESLYRLARRYKIDHNTFRAKT
jgi:DNA-binding NtrC family response regulator